MALQDLSQLVLSTDDRVERAWDPVLGLELPDQFMVDVDPSHAKVIVRFLHARFTGLGGDSSSLEFNDRRRSICHGSRRLVNIR
jgi:hypothetical protein